MDVILREKVDNLGNLGQRVSVKPGYARNFLLPTGKAVLATTANIAEFEAMRVKLEEQAAEAVTAAEVRKTGIESLGTVKIAARAGTEGRLFGAVGAREVAAAITAAGVKIERKEVRMPEERVNTIGEFQINLHLHTDVDAAITLVVEAAA